MLLNRKDNKTLLLVAFLVLLTRIPFLFNGFGSEEDAWGLMLVARNINLSGIYEVSRFPGHPVQEYLYSLVWNYPAWILNFTTALVSSAGIFIFMATLRELNFRRVIPSGLALAFTPVYFINSTNVMDYTWAITLVLLAFYFLVTGKYLLAGALLGLACGFRITAGAMVVPFAVWHYMNHRSWKDLIRSGLTTFVTAGVCYLPAFNVYGAGFFTYYEYFPYPPLLKNLYKATVGAWGIIGWLAIIAATVIIVIRIRKAEKIPQTPQADGNVSKDTVNDTEWNRLWKTAAGRSLIWMCSLTILLYTYSFLKIPQKTAFVIPMIPFIIILLTAFLSQKQLFRFALTMIASSYLMGVNLDDPLRGSTASPFAIRSNIGDVPVAIDPLAGPVMADHSKRKLKINFASSVVGEMATTNEKTVVIAGWWQNELNWFSMENQNPLVTYLYYADEPQLKSFIGSGYRIFYLPEQDYWNDIRYPGAFTASYARPLPVGNRGTR